MGRTPKDVTDAELAVLRALWDRDDATVRDLADEIYRGEPAASAAATVQKLLERLLAKGLVARRTGGRAHRYSAAVDRDALIGRQLQETADKLCEGSLAPLLTHLVNEARLGSDDIAALEAFVERAAKRRRKGRR